MKRKYIRHDPEYAVGENEALYTAMAKKGWRVTKRGAYFSRFERAEPADVCYRIELAAPGWLEDETLPDEQLAFYEDCGWHLAAHHGLVYVFAAPAGSNAPELYSDPRQQAGMLRALRRKYRSGWLVSALVVALYLLLAAALRGGTGDLFENLAGSICLAFVQQTAAVLAYAALGAWAVFENVCGSVCTMRLYRRLKRGEAIDRTPHRRVARRVGETFFALTVLFVLLMAAQWVTRQSGTLPGAAEGPYLLIEDVGPTGEREAIYGKEPSLMVSRSLAARHYDLYEPLVTESGEQLWMFEDVYELRSEALALPLARALMQDATFSHRDEFAAFDIPGLDYAWHGPACYVAIRGNRVCTMTYSGPSRGDGTWGAYDPAVFEALAQRWAE